VVLGSKTEEKGDLFRVVQGSLSHLSDGESVRTFEIYAADERSRKSLALGGQEN